MSITPYLMVDDAATFGRFLQSTFAATIPVTIPLDADPSRTTHAEARISGDTVFFADSGPNGEKCQDSPPEPVHVQLWATIPDAEETHGRAVAAGATSVADVTLQPDGAQVGGFVDPFGTLWWLRTPA